MTRQVYGRDPVPGNLEPYALLVLPRHESGIPRDADHRIENQRAAPTQAREPPAVVDADSVLERDALLRIMVPILEDPKRVVAVGGIVRVLNGSEIQGGQLRRVRLPRKSIEAIQVIEYLRAFLIGGKPGPRAIC
jgi:hypothetical protein